MHSSDRIGLVTSRLYGNHFSKRCIFGEVGSIMFEAWITDNEYILNGPVDTTIYVDMAEFDF
jgi:hypothetical protein